ncbi:hypothetical protein QFC21_007291 [Naganishia friedmannii]|uniref:Uncharacterized protein n=1 Tax=Naganishia friedmannii TaxID=89922 RepID=A0ACC2UWK9_9TREE|nr:hypothetical protein QFC21_007291 [Naganishia friedmannii]
MLHCGDFGVGVQKQCLSNIDTFLNEANSVRRFGQEKYYPNPTNMEHAWCQCPKVQDHVDPQAAIVFSCKAAVATIDRNGFSGARIDLEDLLTGATYILSHMRKNWAKVHDPKSKGDKEEANVLY